MTKNKSLKKLLNNTDSGTELLVTPNKTTSHELKS